MIEAYIDPAAGAILEEKVWNRISVTKMELDVTMRMAMLEAVEIAKDKIAKMMTSEDDGRGNPVDHRAHIDEHFNFTLAHGYLSQVLTFTSRDEPGGVFLHGDPGHKIEAIGEHPLAWQEDGEWKYARSVWHDPQEPKRDKVRLEIEAAIQESIRAHVYLRY